MSLTGVALAVDRVDSNLTAAREAFHRGAWSSAHRILSEAAETLGADDLWRLAVAAYLIGREDEFVLTLQRAHQLHLDAGETLAAARTAFWLGFHFVNRGDSAQGSGWFGRASRLLEGEDPECAERGYMLLPVALRQVISSDFDAAADTAAHAVSIGQRVGDRDLLALALHVHGRALLRHGRVEAGLALLDEAMVAVATGELSPQVTGLIYCSVIGACREVWAVGRVREWTSALSDWCARQQDMVAYTGECRVYRAEVLQLQGEWRGAAEEARRAAERLAANRQPAAAGFACYQQAEVHRLRGELAAAEDCYRAATRFGRDAQPGLSLLRLAQGDSAAASAAIRRAVAEARGRLERARLLAAHIEIMLEVGDVAEAKRASDELQEIAQMYASSILDAVVTRARGALELASGNTLAALPLLRRAYRDWEKIGVPYEAARTRVLIGRACHALGDEDGAMFELDAARSELQRLGAQPDVDRIDSLRRRSARGEHGLTRREREVLALLATGRTNRAIGEALSISEKTVARHVANIFTKLGLSSRAAATAYAYEHGLLDRSA